MTTCGVPAVESVTLTPNAKEPVAVTVPEITPLDDTVMPGGKVPESNA
ncbi:hypothetical protein JANLI_04600 [Janthinobacterium lividum]|nr:hypothetical protein JANLI_04600 [Janthinobacterium lividum]